MSPANTSADTKLPLLSTGKQIVIVPPCMRLKCGVKCSQHWRNSSSVRGSMLAQVVFGGMEKVLGA
eukprot:3941392-Rhodomonas_salina.1